jgi:Tol biopolymer transport system component
MSGMLKVLAFVVVALDVASSGGDVAPATQARFNRIPDSAEIVYHQDGAIYVMDRDGRNQTRITFGEPRNWEHAAVSPNRRFIAANEQWLNPHGDPGGRSRLWIFDLARGTTGRLLPHFVTAGNGGVDWDHHGFIYFAAKASDPVPNPVTPADFIANAGANDVYKVRFDGRGLYRLTDTPMRGEADVSVSEDGTLVTFMDVLINPPNDLTEIWVMRADGREPRLVLTAGAPRIASVHDPELSADNRRVVFSRVNLTVPPNFPHNPAANTAHDLYSANLDGTGLTLITEPGPISIVPDWQDDLIVYLEGNEKDRFAGAALISATGAQPRRIKAGASSPKWIPRHGIIR